MVKPQKGVQWDSHYNWDGYTVSASYLCIHQNFLERLVKYSLLDLTLRFSDSVDWDKTLESVFLTSVQGMLMVLVQGLDFENHRPR